MNITAVQLDSVWENKAANFAKVHQLLDATPPAPRSLVVLPETFSTGFSTNTATTAQGQPPEGEVFLSELARQYQATVIGGVVSGRNGRKPRNESVTVGPDGRLVARYAKIQPFSGGGETQCHEAGAEIVTFELGGFVVAPFICYDLRFPELFRAAVRRGANLLVVIASWPVMRDRHWLTLLQARAIENLAYVVGVNRCGRDPQFYHSGRSAVVDPHGVIIANAGEGEKVFTARIEPEIVAAWRREFPALRDMGWRDA
jgi:predicted amidohydrolase